MNRYRILLVWVASILVMVGSFPRSAAAEDLLGKVVLDEPALDESSGLAASGIRPNRFWSHNDSGDVPRLFAFDARTGRKTAEWRLRRAEAVDWEDMASYREGDIARILVADCGDNNAKRSSIRLYLFDEPDPDRAGERDHPDEHDRTRDADRPEASNRVGEIGRYRRIDVVYPDGPRDCEAVAVDTTREVIVLIEKAWGPLAGIYTLPLPERDPISETRPGEETSRIRLRATRVGTVTIPLVTAMDLEPGSGEIWVTNYFQAFRFGCEQRDEAVAKQLSRVARGYDLPRWRQIEAVAVEGPERVWVTTEGIPARLGRIGVGENEVGDTVPD